MASFTKETETSAQVVQMESLVPHLECQYSNDALAQRGAILMEEEISLSVWQTAKLHWRALLICTLSNTLDTLNLR